MSSRVHQALRALYMGGSVIAATRFADREDWFGVAGFTLCALLWTFFPPPGYEFTSKDLGGG